ncbi:MAG: hypothetical protein K5840_06260 [Eubacterium sp.]|nr:hypothetical protein [Eubacterium sp.]
MKGKLISASVLCAAAALMFNFAGAANASGDSDAAEAVSLSCQVASGDAAYAQDAVDTASMIKGFVIQAGVVDGSDSESIALADSLYEDIEEAYDDLSEEQREAISDSYEAFENAADSLALTEQAAGEGELADRDVDEVLENSWRYNNGQLITHAVAEVTEEIAEVQDGVSDAGSDPDDNSDDGEDDGIMSTDSTADDIVSLTVDPTDADSVSRLGNAVAGGAAAIIVSYVSDSPSYSGVDFSKWQGDVDWTKGLSKGMKTSAGKKRSLQFAILRIGSTTGTSSSGYSYTQDSKFDEYAADCEAAGIPYGVYYYSKATSVAMLNKEVAVIIDALDGYAPSLPIYLDMEDSSVTSAIGTDAEISAIASAYTAQMALAGYQPGIYASVAYWYDYLETFAESDNLSYHWIAQYADYCAYADEEAIADYGKSWAQYQDYQYYQTWQYSSTGTAVGSWVDSTYIDLDYWYGELPTSALLTSAEGKLAKPTLTLKKANTSKIVIKWTKVAGAKGYYVYKKGGSYSKWTAVATVTGTRKYVDTDIEPGYTYQYRVQAYADNALSKLSSSPRIVVTYPKVTNLKSSMKVKWKKVSGATSYTVYRKASSGSWTAVTTVTTNYYKDKHVSNGVKYRYKVVVNMSGTDGSSTTQEGIKTPETYRLTRPTITKLKNKTGAILMTKWSMNGYATGYEIQYSKNSSVSSYKKSKVKSYLKLKKKKSLSLGTWYVRVRAYKTVSGVTSYSSWSKVKSITLTK